MNGPDKARELRRAGWVLDRTNGVHHVFKHPEAPGLVIVPHIKKDLGPGLMTLIRRQAGLQEG